MSYAGAMKEIGLALWAALEGPIVDGLQLVIAALAALAVAKLHSRAARIAARDGARHAEVVSRETGDRGSDKMDVAHTHARGVMGVFAPRPKRFKTLITEEIPEARESLVPPDPDSD